MDQSKSYSRRGDQVTLEEWLEYKKKPTREFERRVYELYDYIPRTIAYKFVRKKPNMLDLDDLIQAGREGLMQAITRYNPSKKTKFNTFATFRIRGAILDQINDVDWTPRPVRERIKKVIKVIESLNTELQDSSYNAAMIAERIEGMTEEEVEQVLQQVKKTYISPVDHETLSGIDNGNFMMSPNLNKYDHLKTVMNMVLDYQERMIIEMKYFGGYKDYEIVEKLNISTGQMHRSFKVAIEKLNHNLNDQDFK